MNNSLVAPMRKDLLYMNYYCIIVETYSQVPPNCSEYKGILTDEK